MNMADLKNVSLLGRIVYGIMCAEKYAVEKYPEKDWKLVFTPFWDVSDCEAMDEWSWVIMEYIPKYLFEFPNYQTAEFEYIDESTYHELLKVYEGVDENVNQILLHIRSMEEEYAYSDVPDEGKVSLEILQKVLNILESSGITPPDPKKVAFSQFSERKGWGNQFDGRHLSITLAK